MAGHNRTNSGSEEVFSRYSGLLGVDSGDLFLANLFEAILETLAQAALFPWCSESWLKRITLDIQCCTEIIRSRGVKPQPLDPRTRSPVLPPLDENKISAGLCEPGGRNSLASHGLKTIILLLIDMELQGVDRVSIEVACLELRRALMATGQRDSVLLELPEPTDSNYMVELPRALQSIAKKLVKKGSGSPSSKPLNAQKRFVDALLDMPWSYLEDCSPSLLSSNVDEVPSADPRRRPEGESPDSSVNLKPRRTIPGSTRARILRLKPKHSLTDDLLIGKQKFDDEGVAFYQFYVEQLDHKHSAPSAGSAEVVESEQAGLSRVNRSRHWLRDQSRIGPAHRRTASRLELDRFTKIHKKNIKEGSPARAAWSLANLVSLYSPCEIEEFLYSGYIFEHGFTVDGQYILRILKVETGYSPNAENQELFTGKLDSILLEIPEFLRQRIEKLLTRDDVATFAEALGVSREEVSSEGKLVSAEYSDGGRFQFDASKVNSALRNQLSIETENSSLAFILAGSDSDMYPTLMFYWGASESRLQSAFGSALNNLSQK